MTLGLPSPMRLEHEDRALTLLGTSGWTLNIVDKDGKPVLLPIGPAGLLVPPDIDWMIAENRAGRLRDVDDLAVRRSRGMPTEEIERHLCRTVRVVLTTNGIEFDNLRYRWNERGVERALNANLRRVSFADRLEVTGRCEMAARVWDSDLDYIDVYDPENREYHRLFSTDPDYSAGLTRWEHHEYQRMLRSGKGGGSRPVDRLRVRNRLLRDQATAMPKMAFRARAATVALLEHEEMRVAAGALGRSKAYDDLLDATVPTGPSGADREDVPRAPPQTAAERRARQDDDPDDDVHAPNRSDQHYPIGDRGAGIGEGDAEGRPTSIWDDESDNEEE